MADNSARRRSVDVGGLALALSDEHRGHGWGGWDETDSGETRYAEVLIDVRLHTETIVSQEGDQPPSWVDILPDTRKRLIHSLSSWHFEPHKLPEEEVLACSYILFEALFRIEHMSDAISVPLNGLAAFLQHLRQLYRQGNSYHNFQHALDVFQAVYFFLFCAGVVPPVTILLEDGRTWERDKDRCDPLVACLTHQDLFALFVAAVGHDVGHPGLTNAFMRNAKTPLSVVYDDKSVLEQMHYSLIMQIMRHNHLGFLLDRPLAGPAFRKLLLGAVLATDMGVHYAFMADFGSLVQGRDVPELTRRVLVCQALIKCADISNPSRPYLVSQHWATALESEWSSQLLLEKHLRLPPSVKPSESREGEAKGQLWFNNTFARPLFELVAQGVPAMGRFAHQTRENYALWQKRADELAAADARDGHEPDQDEAADEEHDAVASGTPIEWPSQAPEDFRDAFPPALPESFRLPEDPRYPSFYHPLHHHHHHHFQAQHHPHHAHEGQSQGRGQGERDEHDHRCASAEPSSSSGSTAPSQYESCESSWPSPAFAPALDDAPASPVAGLPPPRLELQTSSSSTATSPSTLSSTDTAAAAAATPGARTNGHAHVHALAYAHAHAHSRAPSVASTAGSVSSMTSEATAAIRAAYKASVRKKKSFHRASWSPSPAPAPLAFAGPGPSPLGLGLRQEGEAVPVPVPVLGAGARAGAGANGTRARELKGANGCGCARGQAQGLGSPQTPGSASSTDTPSPSPLTPEMEGAAVGSVGAGAGLRKTALGPAPSCAS